MCEQPVVALLFSFCLAELLLSVDEQASNGTWEGGKRGETEEEGENQFSQTEVGWSNGGLREEEEEERTYFPLITSRSLSGKPWKLALLQPAVPLAQPFFAEGIESLVSSFIGSSEALRWRRPNVQPKKKKKILIPTCKNDKEMAIKLTRQTLDQISTFFSLFRTIVDQFDQN